MCIILLEYTIVLNNYKMAGCLYRYSCGWEQGTTSLHLGGYLVGKLVEIEAWRLQPLLAESIAKQHEGEP